MPYLSDGDLQNMDNQARGEFLSTHLAFGTHPTTGDTLYIPDNDRESGTVVQGVQGVGKSGFLMNLIAYCIMLLQAVIVIDPHGDLVDRCIAQLEYKDLAHTYLLDMTDVEWPFGVNPFSVQARDAVEMARIADGIYHTFETQWSEINSQQHLPRYLRACILTLLCNPVANLPDMYRLLTDDRFRARMLLNVADPTILSFWRLQYDDLAASARMQRVGPLLGRLESILMGRPIIRNILSQRQTTINFRKAIANREIIFIKLPVKLLEQDAKLIGSILVSQISRAIYSFGDLPPEQRPVTNLFIDEFPHFANQQDITQLFTEGRKFRCRLTVAFQFRQQLSSFLQEAIMTARTKVIFQVTPDDARELASLFPTTQASVQPDNMETDVAKFLLNHTMNDPAIEHFVETYLRSLQRQPKKDGQIPVKKPGFRPESLVAAFLHVDQKELPTITVGDPTSRLNKLLLEVMRTGSADLAIPSEVVEGFCNVGHFYGVFRRSFKRGELLSAGIQFPPHLVVTTPDGLRWVRRPEEPSEWLYNFIFSLRAVMAHLAVNPIGKKTSTTSTEISAMISSLPRRACFVRFSEGETGVIYTDDVLLALQGQPLAERIAFIQAQTHAKYCRPKAEVEQEQRPPEDPPISRSEVI